MLQKEQFSILLREWLPPSLRGCCKGAILLDSKSIHIPFYSALSQPCPG